MMGISSYMFYNMSVGEAAVSEVKLEQFVIMRRVRVRGSVRATEVRARERRFLSSLSSLCSSFNHQTRPVSHITA